MSELDLKWALSKFKTSWRRQAYTTYGNYYDGNHPLAFATDKFKEAFGDVFREFAENACPAVVDALADRLTVNGFRSSLAEIKEEAADTVIPGMPPRKKKTISDPMGERAWDLWTRNRMDLKSTEVHEDAIKFGDAYLLIWPDEQMQPAFWPQSPLGFDIEYDPNNPGTIRRAVKLWLDDVENVWRLNIYHVDRIEKYVSQKRGAELTPLPEVPGWLTFGPDGGVPNPYNRVPVFHFPNKYENRYGVSELRDVVPLQNGLNKSVMDMLIAMEFASFKQRYAVGYEVETDESGNPIQPSARRHGADRMMAFPDPDTKVGQFDATDLNQFIKVQDKFWLSVARVTGTPLHYFYITEGDFPSGEAMKSAEGRFIKRIGDRHTAFGNQWENAMLFAMQIEGSVPEDLTLSTIWADATPRSDSEIADTAVKKKSVGVPRSQLLREMGYREEDIEMFLEESDAEALARSVLKQQENPQEQEPGESRDTTRARQGVPGGR